MFWKKKDKAKEESTNPFDTSSVASSPAPSYSSTPSAAPSYSSAPPSDYSRTNSNRDELFAGARNNNYSQDAYSSSRLGQNNREQLYDEEQDEEVEVAGLKQKIKNVKQDSLASTRAALQRLHETEATAANTMNMLGEQSTQIANVNRHLDMSKAYSDRAANQAEELRQLNRSIFIPVVSNPFRRKEREKKELERLQQDHAEHMEERDRIRQFEYETKARIEETNRANEGQKNIRSAGRRGRSEADRRRYQFEADSEDDAIEDEIDQNLDLMGDALAGLKNMAITMNTTLDDQNKQLGRTIDKVDPLSRNLIKTTDKLNRTR
ncbi:hypothetical protein BCV72DRAFT_114354 [Rhizopus microsporus var. microsporus]|uniref:t-SNARE coiled-coil homology domain-containing protein n=2 Tax=Rhizopus microsporus TaxID=58291 RepID=A0A2G4SKT5_RHIZD|nr:uncharacterized protein RHIMIDRAFT_286293 [Rhizopus microsporus ATCC 52813]ORE11222.1 hypothetical protein BCV72DRAFT_114354 [Rhizopus microsporus var. microsporus]PHZ08996.1 hypothetical protein RHIMIDRAFT_286293 [Rhizopus microsporus ATCC 52813]